MDHEVIVIGGGYAGLVAALAVRDAGRDVVVLEARARVGGRVHTEAVGVDGVGDVRLDLGGMWVGATHDRFRALLSRFAIETFATPEHGRSAWWDASAEQLRATRVVPAPLSAAPAAALAVGRIDQLARRVPAGEPRRMPDALRWDSVTVADWLRRRVPNRHARATLDSSLVTSFSVEMSQVSMFTLLATVAESGGLLALLGTEGGAQQDLVRGGADAAARRVAQALGDRVILEVPVGAVRAGNGGVEVVGCDGTRTARRVIVALPPGIVAGLDWGPMLPGSRRSLLARTPMGTVTKVLAVYERPFWRDAGWSGEVVDADGPVTSAFDATEPGGAPVLASLTCGRRSVALADLTSEERRARVIEAFVTWFGSAAAAPRHVVDRSWENEPHSGGGYSAVPVPGAALDTLDLAAPIGRIHFAGTETAARHAGYIDGAISSGERAAAAVLAELED